MARSAGRIEGRPPAVVFVGGGENTPQWATFSLRGRQVAGGARPRTDLGPREGPLDAHRMDTERDPRTVLGLTSDRPQGKHGMDLESISYGPRLDPGPHGLRVRLLRARPDISGAWRLDLILWWADGSVGEEVLVTLRACGHLSGISGAPEWRRKGGCGVRRGRPSGAQLAPPSRRTRLNRERPTPANAQRQRAASRPLRPGRRSASRCGVTARSRRAAADHGSTPNRPWMELGWTPDGSRIETPDWPVIEPSPTLVRPRVDPASTTPLRPPMLSKLRSFDDAPRVHADLWR